MVSGAVGIDLAGTGHLTVLERPAVVSRHLVGFLRHRHRLAGSSVSP